VNEPDPTTSKPVLAHDEFLRWRAPRCGDANPSELTNDLWTWLVRTRLNAWQANQAWSGTPSTEAGPMWCFDRFGMSSTALPDGRTVHIAGEHEDHYDPDFHIYNDVVIVGPDRSVRILGYPRDVFPPTDFHTATLLPGRIVLIGSLGHPAERLVGQTQVLELDLETFAIRRIATRGDAPGWIHRHQAEADGAAVVIRGGEVYDGKNLWDNVDTWQLDASSWTWQRLTQRAWRQWAFIRADRRPNHLWSLRQALWYRGVGWYDDLARETARLAEALGAAPALDLVADLYRPDADAVALPSSAPDEHNVFRVVIDGVTVRFTEDQFPVQVCVEGILPDATIDALQRSVLDKLQRLHGAEWTLLPMG
jgi:hypothetical protein